MIRDPRALLEYEAKRRPELAQMIANIAQISEGEIARASFKLPWMRQALLTYKRDHDASALAAKIAPFMILGHNPDPLGEMRRWQGESCFVRIGRTQLEVCSGQLVWFDTRGVWIDTIYTRVIDPLLRQYTVSCGYVTRSDYMNAVRARTRQLCPEVGVQTSQERVRFYHPN